MLPHSFSHFVQQSVSVSPDGSDLGAAPSTLPPLLPYGSVLQSACLIARYKRFMADVTLDNGQITTLHCPNTGRMTGCAEPGWRVWYSTSANPKRKYPYTWELSQSPAGHWIGVNTGRANALVAFALQQGGISELAGYGDWRQEVAYGEEGSRIDLLLTGHQAGAPDCYVEIKSVTLLGDGERPELGAAGVGFFPDAPSARASKHLRELIRIRQSGQRAMILFCVQHSGIRQVRPATHIDADYAHWLDQALDAGVELLAYGATLTPEGSALTHRLPIQR